MLVPERVIVPVPCFVKLPAPERTPRTAVVALAVVERMWLERVPNTIEAPASEAREAIDLEAAIVNVPLAPTFTAEFARVPVASRVNPPPEIVVVPE